MITQTPIGTIKDHGNIWHASCNECKWQLRKRKLEDLKSLLRSHYRISHLDIPVYLEPTA